MSRRHIPAAAAILALTMASGTALADPITYAGTFSIADTSPANSNLLTMTSMPGSFSVPLYLNHEVEDVTLATYATTDPTHSNYSLATDDIEGTFFFTKPVNEVKSVNGEVTEATAKVFGHFVSGGKLAWDQNDLTVGFSDGSALDIDLGPSYFANLNGTSDAGAVSANFTLVKEPVAEPASLALLVAGLLGLGMTSLRRPGNPTAA